MNSKYVFRESGITLAEVLIAITIAAFSSASVVAGFIHIQKMSVMAAYRTGAVRVMQSHIERINNLQVNQLTNTFVMNFNYSGMRVTSVSSSQSQEALTNASFKKFEFNSGPTNSVLPVSSTNVVEDSVLGYLTSIQVTDLWVTNTYLGQQKINQYKKVDLYTFWRYDNRNMTNRATVIKPLIN